MSMRNPSHPGELIRESIQAQGWTVAQCAEHLGVTRNTLSRRLNGHAGDGKLQGPTPRTSPILMAAPVTVDGFWPQGNPMDAAAVVDLTADLEVTEDGALTVRTAMEPLAVLTISDSRARAAGERIGEGGRGGSPRRDAPL